MRLTGAAEVLVGHANVVLAQLEAAAADVAAYSEGIVGTVRIAGFATALAELVAPAAAALRASHPRLALTITEPEAPDCFRALARGDADIALSMASRLAPPADDPRFHRRPLRADALDAVLPAGHRLAGRAEIGLAELAGEPFVGPPDGTSCHDVTRQRLRRRRLHARVRALVARLPHDDGARRRRASASRSCRGSRRPSCRDGAVVRPLRAPAPARHVFAATRAGAERRPTVAAVLDALG